MEEVEVNDITSGPEVYQQEEEEDEEEEEEEFLSKSTTDEDDDENELDFCISENEDEMATSEMKFEPQDVTRSITKALLQYLPGTIAQWKEYPREVLDNLFQTFLTSHHFATEREVADARTTWNKIVANRFTDYLNQHKAAAKKASGNFDDPLMWKGRGPPAIRRDYWDAMCDKWATEDFRHRSKVATENRTKMPEATLHTSGSISFGRQKRKMEKEKGGSVSYKVLFEHTHRKKNTGDFVSEKAKEETYAEHMADRHGGDSTQHPEFDAMAWLAATGQPKKG
ncbi:hypothetical protein Taro_024792 [Colocasia esculenta]|uniref:Uncharacterized protein n=1 Tax=Colocasia esculenta TaxID=4460 RepID=A0A843V778_COLES|nr:hypothetical protein [Colocasia esculenta]